jgi:hypothetical protein
MLLNWVLHGVGAAAGYQAQDASAFFVMSLFARIYFLSMGMITNFNLLAAPCLIPHSVRVFCPRRR